MATRAAFRGQPEIIDLSSDDDIPRNAMRLPADPPGLDDDGDIAALNVEGFGLFDRLGNGIGLEAAPELQPAGQLFNFGGEEVFIPDEDAPPALPDIAQHDGGNMHAMVERALAGAAFQADEDFSMLQTTTVTADSCLQRVLEIFPDISHEHVLKLYNGFDAATDHETLPRQARLDNIIEQLVSATSYPKQERPKGVSRKRKREDSPDEDASGIERWEGPNRPETPPYLKSAIRHVLKREYPDVSLNFIDGIMLEHKHFFQSYVALAEAKDRKDPRAGRGRPSSRISACAESIERDGSWPALSDEIAAARLRVVTLRAERSAEAVRKQGEEANLQKAKLRGETAECSACFDELPMNRQVHCDGDEAHFTCYDCMETYITSEVGEARCKVLCTAGCGAPYAHNQLNLLSNKQLLDKLAELVQEKAIRDAGMEDLEECPGCDFKAIVPPIEEDFEFRCANPGCEMVSCRRCKTRTHIPISCEQHAKENKSDARHTIEEAMTAALVRSCNKCKKQFIKELGCNKMSCPSCGNLQCYVCSETIKDYAHFDHNAPSGHAPAGGPVKRKCPLYDNVDERHEREVKEAKQAARKQVLEQNPELKHQDLEIEVSEAVRKATEDRIKRAGLPEMPLGYAYNPGAYGHDGAGDDHNDAAMHGELRLLRAARGGNAPDDALRQYHIRRRHQQIQQHLLRQRQQRHLAVARLAEIGAAWIPAVPAALDPAAPAVQRTMPALRPAEVLARAHAADANPVRNFVAIDQFQPLHPLRRVPGRPTHFQPRPQMPLAQQHHLHHAAALDYANRQAYNRQRILDLANEARQDRNGIADVAIDGVPNDYGMPGMAVRNRRYNEIQEALDRQGERLRQ
ncbi:hypothetical protein LTR62_007643 [Meristemomyces frigidus]|uniref:RING-type domain-containing protein n=1 Tax=Meristemomyces frigidus TaxID=1508187 RepID=A0AAN7TAH4_9PEZI|nr:hypothetical protein LTR62_007643 [Meristemomyces frigidus]